MTEIKPSRRHVVRAGAWTVPAIAVAVAAPAFAASGANLSTSTGTISSPQKPIRVELTIINTGTAPTCALTVTVQSPNAVSSTQTAPSGWVATVNTTTNTVTYTATTQLAAGGTRTVLFVVDRGNNGSGTVTVLIDPGCSGTGRTLSGTAT